MSREYRTLKEVVHNIIMVSDVLESVRGKFSKYSKEDFIKAQEHMSAAIACLKKGISKVDSGTQQEIRQFEQDAEELEQAEKAKAQEKQTNRGE